jgi:hypothetical protein
MVEEYTSEKHYLFLKEKDKHYAHTKGLYFNRAFSSDCHYCIVVGDTNARTTASEETSQRCCMSK